jgi:ubiquitin carboxyl-terminal hydrolase 4/11/15
MKNSSKKKSYQKSIFYKELINLDLFKTYINLNANHGICGSVNLGNTCYMNSSIACLSNCTELTSYFLLENYVEDINKNNVDGTNGELAKYWYKLLNAYWNSSYKVGNPENIKRVVGSKNSKFLGCEQQDSNEFITVFLELLGEDLNRATKKVYEELKEQQKNEKDIDAAERFWKLHYKRNDSIITDLFHGLFKSTIKCPKCNFNNITYEPFNTLTLTIPSSQKIKQLQRRNRKNNKKDDKQKEEVQIYYVSPFSLTPTKKFVIEVYKNMSLNEIVQEIRKRGSRISTNLTFKSISNRKCDEIEINGKNTIKSYNYIFGYEKEDKGISYYSIPIYLSLDDSLSAYPRILFFDQHTSYSAFKRKIYILVRQYLNYPNNNDNNLIHEVEKELTDYINEKSNKLDKVLSLLQKELNFINSNEQFSRYYTKNPPYTIFLTHSITKKLKRFVLYEGKSNNTEILNELNINSDNDYVDNLIENILLTKDTYLIVRINSKSNLVKKGISFDKCVVENIPQLKENDNDEEMEEEEDNYEQITLDHCLQYFTEEELLEQGNEWFCNKCKKRVIARKKLELFYLPRIMIVCLKRFLKRGKFNDYTKNNSFVKFQIKNLNMENYICGPDKQYFKYDLYAVSRHFGGMGGGHYTAICKNIDGYWYEYDDKACRRSSEEKVCTSAAYVLFYRRKNW